MGFIGCDHPRECSPCQERLDAFHAEAEGLAGQTLAGLARAAHQTAVDKGWWNSFMDTYGLIYPDAAAKAIPEKIALIHSELSEALEEYRAGRVAHGIYYRDENGLDHDATCAWTHCPVGGALEKLKPEGFGVEMADAVIRIMDLCAVLEIDLQDCIEKKMAYNQTRPYRHGGKVA